MPKELVISATPHETRVAVLEEGQLCEIYIEREKEFALVGSIYKGRVTRVLPGMQSAFVDIGLDSDAFLYVSDFLENLEEYDHVVSAVEGKVQRMEQQGGRVFAPPGAAQTTGDQAAPGGEPQETASNAAADAQEHAAGDTPPETAPAPAPFVVPAPSGQPPAAPSYQPRDPGSMAPMQNRGGRGRRDRWGRRGGRDRSRGRELPPSKYASNRPYVPQPYQPRPAEASAPAGEPILLPGESLAKYKDRSSAAPAAPAAENISQKPESTAPTAETAQESHPEALGRSLPESLYVSGASAAPSPAEPGQPQEPSHSGEDHVEAASPLEAHPAETTREEYLSEEEVTSLSEQLAEAKHEEARDETESPAGGEEEEPHEEEPHEEAPHAAGIAEGFEMEEPREETHEESEHLQMAGESGGEAAPAAEGAEHAGPEAPGGIESQPSSARIEDRSRARFQRPMRRGGRPQHGGRGPRYQHDRHAAQRRPQLISEMLKAGQEIIVQIAKEPLGKKGARITSHVALPGRYLVYMPTVDHVGVSRKINSAENRSRLRRLVAEAKGQFPGGFIVRTAAEDASDDEIRSDIEFLGRTWMDIIAHSEQRKAPAMLHRDLNLVERILRDYFSQDYTAIWIDNEEEYSKVVEFVSRFQAKLVNRVKLYTKETLIFEEFGIQQELDKALRPKVWLKSGGYIVINHTEALVAIDVNTGKFVGRGSTRLEDTIVRTNLEAVKEIVRQIRLRDLGGIIVLDFIDMEERRNREKVMAALDQALQADRAPSKVLSFNEFGLVAITRKRTKQALERVLCQVCPYCSGSGMVKSIPTICYEIQAEARKMSAELDSPSLTLRVNPEIAKALKTREASLVEELEQATHKSIIIQSDPTLHWEQYDIY